MGAFGSPNDLSLQLLTSTTSSDRTTQQNSRSQVKDDMEEVKAPSTEREPRGVPPVTAPEKQQTVTSQPKTTQPAEKRSPIPLILIGSIVFLILALVFGNVFSS